MSSGAVLIISPRPLTPSAAARDHGVGWGWGLHVPTLLTPSGSRQYFPKFIVNSSTKVRVLPSVKEDQCMLFLPLLRNGSHKVQVLTSVRVLEQGARTSVRLLEQGARQRRHNPVSHAITKHPFPLTFLCPRIQSCLLLKSCQQRSSVSTPVKAPCANTLRRHVPACAHLCLCMPPPPSSCAFAAFALQPQCDAERPGWRRRWRRRLQAS